MAMLNRKQLNLPEDGQEALFLLPWTERAWDSLKAELGRDGLVTVSYTHLDVYKRQR